MKKRVTGIGGLFFKTKDPKATKEWYKKHLGFNTDDYGCTFWWKDKEGKDCSTQWSPFPENTPCACKANHVSFELFNSGQRIQFNPPRRFYREFLPARLLKTSRMQCEWKIMDTTCDSVHGKPNHPDLPGIYCLLNLDI